MPEVKYNFADLSLQTTIDADKNKNKLDGRLRERLEGDFNSGDACRWFDWSLVDIIHGAHVIEVKEDGG